MSDEIEQLKKKITYLEEQAERWEDDALRLMEERNKALEERDEARREVCRDEAYRPSPSPPCTANQVANRRGWDCFKEEFFVGDDDHAKEGL
jgi:hypothetical protein